MLFSLIIYIYLNNNVSANIVNRFVWASFVCLSCVKHKCLAMLYLSVG